MNREQYLFKLLEEEASEVGQNASKCMRFTALHTAPQYSETNLERLQTELTDFFTVLEMLEEELKVEFDRSSSASKKDRIEGYYNISKQLGTAR
jgi:hypothetical protein